MSQPTHQDAMVMLEMLKLGSTHEFGKATRFIWGEKYIPAYQEFVAKYPRGSEEYNHLSLYCGWFESLGALWKNGLINQQLLNDWLYVPGPWERVKGFALGFREESGNDLIYENFEALANSQK